MTKAREDLIKGPDDSCPHIVLLGAGASRAAFTLTIFGYGAPASDRDAVELLRSAWFGRSTRTFEHIEIIDIANESFLHDRWAPFTPTNHYHVTETFEESRLSRWPRRSCESLVYPMTHGIPCEGIVGDHGVIVGAEDD
jgi:hypothetical protein